MLKILADVKALYASHEHLQFKTLYKPERTLFLLNNVPPQIARFSLIRTAALNENLRYYMINFKSISMINYQGKAP